VNVRVSKRAQAQIERAAEWWDEHRDLAPEAFDEDLAKALLLLSTEPLIGAPVLRTSAAGVRRLHLARIRYHLYYRIRGRTVEVIALWHTSRGAGPFL
jgi:plasmid stabilization system protein ParE